MAYEPEFTRALQVRVSEEQYEAFKKAAKKDGRTLSGWARQRLHEAVINELGSIEIKPEISTRTTSTVME